MTMRYTDSLSLSFNVIVSTVVCRSCGDWPVPVF